MSRAQVLVETKPVDLVEHKTYTPAEHELIRKCEAELRPKRERYNALEIHEWLQSMQPEPERFVKVGEEEPPPHLARVVNYCILERWVPVTHTDPSASIFQLAAMRTIGWKVQQERIDPYCDCHNPTCEYVYGHLVHRECNRPLPPRSQTDADLIDNISTLSLQLNDDALYNGFYPTLPGNDVAHFNPSGKGMGKFQGGQILYGQPDENGVRHPVRGGREIRHGRREHREATRYMHHLGPGSMAWFEQKRKEREEARKRDLALRKERLTAALPRKIGEL